jgi:hypothetical protein
MRIFQALYVFFKVLVNREFAATLRQLQSGRKHLAETVQVSPQPAVRPSTTKIKASARNDAITLLATLQREARFVDIVMEPLGEYSDAQVGAAMRDVLRDCGKTLERLFAIRPLVDEQEGATLETPAHLDAVRYRLTGNVTGEPPYRGQLVHHGWQATRCELPQWSGSEESVMVLAPVELELK